MGVIRLDEEPKEDQKKWAFIHTLLKSTVHSVMGSVWYTMRNHTKKRKQDFKSNEIKRLISIWDDAFANWQKELGIKNYTKSPTYQNLLRMRNIALTIIDEDGPYLKLLYQFNTSFEKLKDDDECLKTPSEELK